MNITLKGKKDLVLASLLVAAFLLLHFTVYIGAPILRDMYFDVPIVQSYTDAPVALNELSLCEELRPDYLHPFRKIIYSYQIHENKNGVETYSLDCEIVEQAESVFTSDMKPLKGDPYDYWKGFEKESFGRPLVANAYPNPIFFFMQYAIIVAFLYILLKPVHSHRPDI